MNKNSKTHWLIKMPLILCTLFLFLSCDPDKNEPSTSIAPLVGMEYKAGDDEPAPLKAAGKAFLGWYTGTGFTQKDFSDIKKRVDFKNQKVGTEQALTGTVSIYPKWADASNYTIDKAKNELNKLPSTAVVELPYNVDEMTVTKIGKKGSEANRINIFGSAEADKTVTTVYFPSKGLEVIGQAAFYSCRALASLVLPDTVTEIGQEAFYSSNQLASVVLSNKLKSIGTAAFRYSNLSSLTIPSSVTSIKSRAFSDNRNLKNVRVEATTPPQMEFKDFYTQFSNTYTNLSITVPLASVSTYKITLGWHPYTDTISGY